MTKFTVEFYKKVTTRDRHSIEVEAESEREAMNKVSRWGLNLGTLTEEEESTESTVKEGDVVESEYVRIIGIL